MISIVKRKRFLSGNSQVISLPSEWVKLHDKKVFNIIYDKDVLVIIPDQIDSIAKDLIKKALEKVSSGV